MLNRGMFFIATWIVILGSCPYSYAQGTATSTPPVVGRDLSGKYTFQRLECYSQSTGSLTGIGTLSNYSETIEVNGNSLTDTITGGSCTFVTRGSVVFSEAGTFSIPDSKVSVSGGNCTLTSDLNVLTQEGATTVPVEITYRDGETIPASSGEYQVGPSAGTVSIESQPRVSIPSGNRCLLVFKRS